MPAGNTAILGISLGTRTSGIAIIKRAELIDWRTYIFKGVWSATKCARIAAKLETLIPIHAIKALAIKLPPLRYHSKGIQDLISALKQVAQKRTIPLKTYGIDDIKNLPKEEIGNKEMLQKHILAKYPELSTEYHKERSNKHAYYAKLFEAIGAAHCFQAAIRHQPITNQPIQTL